MPLEQPDTEVDDFEEGMTTEQIALDDIQIVEPALPPRSPSLPPPLPLRELSDLKGNLG